MNEQEALNNLLSMVPAHLESQKVLTAALVALIATREDKAQILSIYLASGVEKVAADPSARGTHAAILLALKGEVPKVG